MLKCCARTPAASTITPQSLWNTGKWNTAKCFCLLIVFLSFPIFFPYFCLFLFFPSPCETRVSETLQTVFVFSLSFCRFLFFVFSFFSPVAVKHCKLFLSSHCLFVCLSFPILSPHPLWTTNGEWNTASGILSFHFCLDVFLSPRFFAFCPSLSSTTVKHCEQYQDGYLGIFFHLPNKEKSLNANHQVL